MRHLCSMKEEALWSVCDFPQLLCKWRNAPPGMQCSAAFYRKICQVVLCLSSSTCFLLDPWCLMVADTTQCFSQNKFEGYQRSKTFCNRVPSCCLSGPHTNGNARWPSVSPQCPKRGRCHCCLTTWIPANWLNTWLTWNTSPSAKSWWVWLLSS